MKRSTCIWHYLWQEWLFRLHAFIFLCRTNPCAKYPRNSFFYNFERLLYYWYEIKAYFFKNLFLNYFFKKEFNSITGRISFRFWENCEPVKRISGFCQFFRERYSMFKRSTFKKISHNFKRIPLSYFKENFTKFKKKIHVIFKKISRNFYGNFIRLLREFHSFWKNFTHLLRSFHSVFKKISFS